MEWIENHFKRVKFHSFEIEKGENYYERVKRECTIQSNFNLGSVKITWLTLFLFHSKRVVRGCIIGMLRLFALRFWDVSRSQRSPFSKCCWKKNPFQIFLPSKTPFFNIFFNIFQIFLPSISKVVEHPYQKKLKYPSPGEWSLYPQFTLN
jgi:hypothetical protein